MTILNTFYIVITAIKKKRWLINISNKKVEKSRKKELTLNRYFGILLIKKQIVKIC